MSTLSLPITTFKTSVYAKTRPSKKNMKQYLARIALVVEDYDDAIDFYVNKLHFTLIEDTYQPAQEKRWVVIRPPGAEPGSTATLLAKGQGEEQPSRIGNQTGGRVFLFLFTDDFDRDFANLLEKNITIIRQPQEYPYGKVAVFADLYGNLWDLLEPSPDPIL